MRKAILNENKKVVGFVPVQEELSEQAKAQRQKQVDYIAKKYGFDKGTKQSPRKNQKKIKKSVDIIQPMCYNDNVRKR